MTNKILITFVGISKYDETSYYKDDQFAVKTRYIQEAIYELYCKDFTETDCIYFLLTEDAERNNWLSINKEKFGEGIEYTFAQLKEKAIEQNKPFPQVKKIRISDRQDEKGIWELFDQINQLIDKDSEVYFDITNAFRSLPIVASAILNYAKFTKNIHIEHVLYGNYTKGKEYSPIHDIASMVNIFEWTNGVETYLRTGEAALLKEIVKEDPSSEEAKEYEVLIEKLDDLNQVLATCRGFELQERISAAKESLKAARNITTDALKPISDLFSKIEEKLAPLRENNTVYIYFDVAKWCLEHSYIQQSATFLREGINRVLSDILKLDYKDKTHVGLVTYIFFRAGINKSLKYKHIKEDMIKHNEKSQPRFHYNLAALDECKELLEEVKPFLIQLFENKEENLFKRLTNVRNQMNHASLMEIGEFENLHADRIVEELKYCIDKMEHFYRVLNDHFNQERVEQ